MAMLKVKKIDNGTVIDHIPTGKALDVLKIMGGTNSSTTVLAMNVSSSTYGKKDVLKVEDFFIDQEKADLVSLIAPYATINIIKKAKVVEKKRVQLPRKIYGALKCLNPNCITNQDREPVQTRFSVRTEPLRITCSYCETEYDERLLPTLFE
jgi:aspartate carbamoyltransferase regulatory subunit